MRLEADENAVQAAMEWLIRLREEPDNAALRRLFEAWRSQDPSHRFAWAEAAEVYNLVDPAATPVGGAFPQPDMRRASRFKSLSRPIVTGVAGVALAACLVMIFAPGLWLSWRADYATGTAQQRRIALADGSTIELGPASALDVRYSANARNVRLLAGQAYFEVRHDASRPFVVQANGAQITDLGTGFDVTIRPGHTAVSVTHGLVEVTEAGATRRLSAGSWVRVSAQGVQAEGTAPSAQIAAWRQGKLIATDRAAAEVIDDLRPYFGGFILTSGDRLAKERVTGVYDLRDPAGALTALARAHPGVTVRRITPWVLAISAD